MTVLPKLTIIDPVKCDGQSYAGPVLTAASEMFDAGLLCRPQREAVIRAWMTSDACWIDWCTEEAVVISKLNERRQKPLFIRLHAFEVLESDSGREVAWQNVTALIAVSHDVLRLLREQVPDIDQLTNTFVVPNGIDLTRFKPSASFNASNIAWVGVLSPKKNPYVALWVLRQLVEDGGDYQLHVAGEAVNRRTVQHFNFLVDKLALNARVHLYGYIDDIADWYRDKGVLLSTSLYESFGLAIAEAAASGLYPVLFDFPNARDLWPEAMLVSTVDQACEAVRNSRPNVYRSYVGAKYPLEGQLDRLTEVLKYLSGRHRTR